MNKSETLREKCFYIINCYTDIRYYYLLQIEHQIDVTALRSTERESALGYMSCSLILESQIIPVLLLSIRNFKAGLILDCLNLASTKKKKKKKAACCYLRI